MAGLSKYVDSATQHVPLSGYSKGAVTRPPGVLLVRCSRDGKDLRPTKYSLVS